MTHTKLIRALVDKCRYLQAEVQRLEVSAGEAEEDAANVRAAAEHRARRAEERARHQEQDATRARQTAELRQWEQRETAERLQRALRYGDRHEVDRLTRSLRSL